MNELILLLEVFLLLVLLLAQLDLLHPNIAEELVSSLFLLFLELRDLAAGVRLRLRQLGGPSTFRLFYHFLTFDAHLRGELLRLGRAEVLKGLEADLRDGLDSALATHDSLLFTAYIDEWWVGVLAAHKR